MLRRDRRRWSPIRLGRQKIRVHLLVFAHEKRKVVFLEGGRAVEYVDEFADVAGVVVVHDRGNLLSV